MYLRQQHNRWWAYHQIPAKLQAQLGRKRFMANLHTRDKAQAEFRAALKKAEWLAAIEYARTGADMGEAAIYYRKALLQAAEQEGMAYRDALKSAASSAERAEIKDRITDKAFDKAYDIDGVPQHHAELGENNEERPGYQAGLRFLLVATGELIKLMEHLEAYLATLKNKKEKKTVAMKKSTIEKFAAKFPYIADVQQEKVQEWINIQDAEGVAKATIQRSLSEMRGYWRYLQSKEADYAAPKDASPFEKLSFPEPSKDDKADDKANKRRAFKAAEVLKLLAAARGNDPLLADLIEIAMWTGARIEEICALKVKRVNLEEEYFEIGEAKTDAGCREVPIHTKLMPTMRRLIEASDKGYVLSGLSENKYKDRSNAIGKRFGRLKTVAGFGPQYVFHSIRKTVATLLRNARVPEGDAADILGHEKQTITYGLYADVAPLDVKRVAIEKLSYDAEKTEQRRRARSA